MEIYQAVYTLYASLVKLVTKENALYIFSMLF